MLFAKSFYDNEYVTIVGVVPQYLSTKKEPSSSFFYSNEFAQDFCSLRENCDKAKLITK